MDSLEPDIILFGGDLLEVDRDDVLMEEVEKLLRQLKAPYEIYGVFGNHERYGRTSIHSFYRNAYIMQLHDSAVLNDSSFYLVGRLDARNPSQSAVNQLSDRLSQHFPVLMLDHQPTDIDAVKKTVVDVQFSGHTTVSFSLLI